MFSTVDDGARTELQEDSLLTSTACQLTSSQGCSFKAVTHVSSVLPADMSAHRESVFISIREQ